MKLQLGVMFGGASVEHEISILSAIQAMDHLDSSRYDILPIYIAKDHQMYHSEQLRNVENFKDLDRLLKGLSPISLCAKGNRVVIQEKARWFHKEKTIDLVLPIMHGTYGEDGTVQGYLRMLGLPFCGSELLGACIGQDKIVMKQLLRSQGIPEVDWAVAEESTIDDKQFDSIIAQLSLPLIVKPAALGSSVGIHVAKNKEELQEALKDAFQYDRRVIIEQALTNMKEYNCAVLGDEEGASTSCIEEVLKQDEILSYHDKYEGNGKSKGMVSASRIIPAALSEAMREEIEQLALRSFACLQASGVVRIDFLYDAGNDKLYVNEINTIPGSLSFYLFSDQQISFSQLLDRLIALALRRQRRHARMIFSYQTNVLASFQGGTKLMK